MFEQYRDRGVIVTGGSGFIGKHLISALLQAGARVVSFNREKLPEKFVDTCYGNICNRGDVVNAIEAAHGLMQRPVEFVFHLAGQNNIELSNQYPLETFQINSIGTLNLLEALRNSPNVKSIVLVSTAGVNLIDRFIVGGNDCEFSSSIYSPYNCSKMIAEAISRSYTDCYHTPIAICRLYNTYGPGQKTKAVIASVLRQMILGKSVNIGNLFAVRDFVYIKDVIYGLLKIALNPKSAGQTIDVGTGKGYSIAEMIEIAKEICGFRGQIIEEESRYRLDQSQPLVADISKIESLIDWRPQYELHRGLAEMIDEEKRKI